MAKGKQQEFKHVPFDDPMIAYLKPLVGARIEGLAYDPGSECYGLRLDNGKIAWIQCDPEGNGAGFLSIEKEQKG